MESDSGTVWNDLPKDARELPPSSKLVMAVLYYEGNLLFRELQAKTRLPPSTLREALRRCRDAGYVETSYSTAEPNLKDYSICSPSDNS